MKTNFMHSKIGEFFCFVKINKVGYFLVSPSLQCYLFLHHLARGRITETGLTVGTIITVLRGVFLLQFTDERREDLLFF